MSPLIALIPTFGTRPYLANMLEWLNGNNAIAETFVSNNQTPRIPANVRNDLLNEAFAKYGKDAYYLMLDDDCIMDGCNLNAAVEHFKQLPGLGIVALPLRLAYPADGRLVGKDYIEVATAGHCFIISGSVLEAGIRYTENEYCDELDFSFKTWLSGFKNIITLRTALWHHITPHKTQLNCGVNVENIKSGAIIPQSTFLTRNAGLIECNTQTLYDIEMPIFYTIKPTQEAIELRKQNQAK
jgi:hypothetical protein